MLRKKSGICKRMGVVCGGGGEGKRNGMGCAGVGGRGGCAKGTGKGV